MREWITPALRPAALDLVRGHQQQGDTVAIVTATNEMVTGPIAAVFGVPELIAVELERDAAGWITGEIAGVPSMREGKVVRVQQWLAGRGQGQQAVVERRNPGLRNVVHGRLSQGGAFGDSTGAMR